MSNTEDKAVLASKITKALSGITSGIYKHATGAVESAKNAAVKLIDALDEAKVDYLTPKALKRVLREAVKEVHESKTGEKLTSDHELYVPVDSRIRCICRHYAKLTEQSTSDAGNGGNESTPVEKAEKAIKGVDTPLELLKLATDIIPRLTTAQRLELVKAVEVYMIENAEIKKTPHAGTDTPEDDTPEAE